MGWKIEDKHSQLRISVTGKDIGLASEATRMIVKYFLDSGLEFRVCLKSDIKLKGHGARKRHYKAKTTARKRHYKKRKLPILSKEESEPWPKLPKSPAPQKAAKTPEGREMEHKILHAVKNGKHTLADLAREIEGEVPANGTYAYVKWNTALKRLTKEGKLLRSNGSKTTFGTYRKIYTLPGQKITPEMKSPNKGRFHGRHIETLKMENLPVDTINWDVLKELFEFSKEKWGGKIARAHLAGSPGATGDIKSKKFLRLVHDDERFRDMVKKKTSQSFEVFASDKHNQVFYLMLEGATSPLVPTKGDIKKVKTQKGRATAEKIIKTTLELAARPEGVTLKQVAEATNKSVSQVNLTLRKIRGVKIFERNSQEKPLIFTTQRPPENPKNATEQVDELAVKVDKIQKVEAPENKINRIIEDVEKIQTELSNLMLEKSGTSEKMVTIGNLHLIFSDSGLKTRPADFMDALLDSDYFREKVQDITGFDFIVVSGAGGKYILITGEKNG